MKIKRKVKGFTLIELIVVIAILSVVAYVGVKIYKERFAKETPAAEPTNISIQPPVAEDIVYKASTEFNYSTDGTNWNSKIVEFPVGIRYYMDIVMRVSQSEETKNENVVKAEVSIPMTKIESCRLAEHSGEVTPRDDSINGTLVYDFNIVSDVNPENFTAIFKCIPKEAGDVTIDVVYDEKVSQNWDKYSTLFYVNND